MSIRLPLKGLLDSNTTAVNATGPASTSGGVANAFLIPQDCDNIVVKLEASVMGGGVSATLQTSDNGGATWYDVARTSTVSNTGGSVLAQWLSVPVTGVGARTGYVIASTVATGSVQATTSSLFTTIGSAGASTLAVSENSGLPILGVNARVFRIYGAAVTSIINERVQVFANSQSAHS